MGSVIDRQFAADYFMLTQWVAESALVFEVVFEDLDIKKKVAGLLSRVMEPMAIACSDAPGLFITTLAEQYSVNLRSRFVSVHMFNLAYS